MVEDLKSSFKKKFFSKAFGDEDESNEEDYLSFITKGISKEFLNSILSRAGQSKDELVQILGKEMGFALAAMLKEPLHKLVASKKLQITLELVDKQVKVSTSDGGTSKKSTKSKASAKKSVKKKSS